MFSSLLKRVFGSKNEREIKRILKKVEIINSYEKKMILLKDRDLHSKTTEFRRRLVEGESLDDILPEAFAVCREAGKRTIKMRHFDVQLIGGIVLHEGKIAEMRTGEGKTLVATLPVYLNSISGKGVHVVTTNDYLASRDSQWMRPLYEFLGLTLGVIRSSQSTEEKIKAYASDITYATNNELGFDYLRDNMVFSLNEKIQKSLNFAVIDEVDSILIDEARTPLIISGNSEDSSGLYKRIDKMIPILKESVEEEGKKSTEKGHFIIDEKSRQIELNEEGHQLIEETLVLMGLIGEEESLYAASNLGLLTHIYVALRAHKLFQRNIDYIVKGGEILLIDEHTGRTMPGRRLSEGLHQAIEAKENLSIQPESQTLASTTFQNYFRLYNKLSGMTGTADTEAFEFQQIYRLPVVVIPTNRTLIRKDYNDLVYITASEKYSAIIEDIKESRIANRPILVGTATIESSEYLSSLLKKELIPHKVLNAKFHEKEAEIIAQAGRPGALTIATNMAGRGTDIVLGGNWEMEVASLTNPSDKDILDIKDLWKKRHQQVLKAGGLQVIASERHESRRIDNQLRGRSGRQGDPGSTRFYLSLEDNLMRIFASSRLKSLMKALGVNSGEAIEHNMVTSAIEKAQGKVESRNFDIRKQVLDFDDINNEQRKVIYHMRNTLLSMENTSETINSFRLDVLNKIMDKYIPRNSLREEWDIRNLVSTIEINFKIRLPIKGWMSEEDNINDSNLRSRVIHEVSRFYDENKQKISLKELPDLEKKIILQVLDDLWKEHLSTMDYLRQGIHLRGYAQKNPKQEYKRESFELFSNLLEEIKLQSLKLLSDLSTDKSSIEEGKSSDRAPLTLRKPNSHNQLNKRNTGRNSPCHCGSGKKLKYCHGKI